MNIIINNEKIDFTLEQENSLADVLDSVEKWLRGSRMTISSVRLNGSFLPPSDLVTEGRRALSDIAVLEFNASPITTFRTEEINSILQYLISLKKAILSGDTEQLDSLVPLFPDAHNSLNQYFTPKDTGKNESVIDIAAKYIEGSTSEMFRLLDDATKSEIEKSIDLICEALIDISKKLTPLKKEQSLDFIEEMKPTVARLNEIPILLQTGKDGQAMESLALFSEVAQRFLVMVSEVISENQKMISIDGQTFEEFSVSLNELLRELVSAFDRKDYILIGDLCEYEIAPRIEKLIICVQKELSV